MQPNRSLARQTAWLFGCAALVIATAGATRAASTEQARGEPAFLRGGVMRVALPAQRTSFEGERQALLATLTDFFMTADLVDRAVDRAQARANEMRSYRVVMGPMPEVGQLYSQFALMNLVRSFLRDQGRIAG